MKLFKDQKKFIKRIKKSLQQGYRHLICQSPTGSGKTVMFGFIASKASKKKKKVLIITDRIELLTQSGGTLEKFSINPAYIKAGTKIIDESKYIYVAMSQTLRNRIKLKEWYNWIKNDIDIVIIDEAHIQEFNYLFSDNLLKKKIVLSWTATPMRSGKMRQLGLDYDKIIRGKSIKDLISKGRLVNCDIYDCGKPDLKGVAMNYAKGDYAETAMFKRYDNNKTYKGLIKNYKRITPNEKMIVFCCNIEHAIKTTIRLNKHNLSAKFVCSSKTLPKLPKSLTAASRVIYDEKLRQYEFYKENFDIHSGKRDDIFAGFKNNEFKILVNVGIATKGYDCPDVKVIALCRATVSLTLYLQMIGRGGRTFPDKSHFTLLDFGGNKQRFGGYDLHRDWALWHEESTEGGIPPMKECGLDSNAKKIKGDRKIKEGCKRLILAAHTICPFCGFKYPEKNEAAEIDLLLERIKDKNGVSLKSKSFKDMSHEELHKYREIKAHRTSWLWRILWNRGGEKELLEFSEKYDWSKKSTQTAVNYCININ